jgi:hypothetical protein
METPLLVIFVVGWVWIDSRIFSRLGFVLFRDPVHRLQPGFNLMLIFVRPRIFSFWSGFLVLFLIVVQPSAAQWNEKMLVPVSLADLSFFQPVAGNWTIAGSAFGLPDLNQHLETKPGAGVLVNRPNAEKKDNLQTRSVYGDVDFQVDFLMPKGSNSGIYFQGRYEIQLFDSWNKENPAFSDCGGVYQRWNPARGKGQEGYEGVAPATNAAMAPGLWQTIKISFEAPRFSASGIKIRNARFAAVWLNGIKIHTNVEVSGPTRGAAFADESATGPLLFQGDHGPVCFRNMKYAPVGNPPLEWANLQYAVYQGPFSTVKDFLTRPPVRQGKADLLDKAHLETEDEYMISYKGDVVVKTPGLYTFYVEQNGKSTFTLDGKLLLDTTRGGFWNQRRSTEVELSAGRHPVELCFLKNNTKNRPGLGLSYSGPGIKLKSLHADGSLTSFVSGGQLILPCEAHPYVQRSFLQHRGVKKPYGINVCFPQGLHFTLNANTGRLLRVWRSPVFGEVSTMWSDRGNQQSLYPMGARQEWMDGALAGFSPDPAAFPDTINEADGFSYMGYQQKTNEDPVFKYRVPNGQLTLHFHPDQGHLKADIRYQPSSSESAALWYCVAEGAMIEKLPDGRYRIDESWYVQLPKTVETVVKVVSGKMTQRILVPLEAPVLKQQLSYSLLW